MNVNRILIVDDDAEDSEFFTTVTHQINPAITVVEASAKDELFLELEKALPDLLFIDSFIKQDSGQEAIKTLRANPVFAHLPVVMYTGSDDNKSIRAAFEAGASFYIVKPQSLAEIKTVLQQVFAKDWEADLAKPKQYYADRRFQNFEF